MNRAKFVLASLATSAIGSLRRTDEPRRGTRVVMYHDVNESGDASDIYSIPLARFASGIARLSEWARKANHRFVPFHNEPRPGIAITFDDGYRSTLQLAAPVFAQFEIPFHVFVTKSYVLQGGPAYLSEGDLKALSQMPLASVGVHGTSHRRFSQLDERALRAELTESRDWLEQVTGKAVTSLSYPHGDFNQAVSNIVGQCGFSAAACSAIGTFTDSSQALEIPRVDIWSHDTPRTTIAKTRGDWDSVLP